jgi:Transposase domain (DUF772)
MHLAWRWFTDLGFDQEIPHHSTFSKNRHGRFEESKLFEELFEQIVRLCVEVGLVRGKHLSVDGSFVEANASKESRIPREQLAEAAQVNQTIRQYLVELEEQNPVEEPVHQQDQVSTIVFHYALIHLSLKVRTATSSGTCPAAPITWKDLWAAMCFRMSDAD